MTLLPVPVKKVAFGSPEFMFLRRDIDIMIRQREALRYCYEDNKELYANISALIRNCAQLVFFIRRPKAKLEIQEYTPATQAPPARKVKEKKIKKETKTLFDI
jgi:hypothetical protein